MLRGDHGKLPCSRDVLVGARQPEFGVDPAVGGVGPLSQRVTD